MEIVIINRFFINSNEMKILNPNSNNIDQILELINKEFVLDRGKKLHIKERFPYLFDESNYQNIYFIEGEGNTIDAVMVVKTFELLFEGQIFNLFMVGSQVIHPDKRGKGIGKFLFEYVSDNYLNKRFDLGVGWTRLQEYYIKTGWHSFENGIFVHCKELKTNYKIISSLNIVNVGTNEYSLLNDYRIAKNQNYIVRKKYYGIEGFGTIYSPGEESICLAVINDNQIIGYMYGAIVNNKAIIYEYILDDINMFPKLIYNLYVEKNIDDIFINLSVDNPNCIDILMLFEAVSIDKPELSIYKYNNIETFNKLKNYYIPFTDRI